jgi:hypothetical protein
VQHAQSPSGCHCHNRVGPGYRSIGRCRDGGGHPAGRSVPCSPAKGRHNGQRQRYHQLGPNQSARCGSITTRKARSSRLWPKDIAILLRAVISCRAIRGRCEHGRTARSTTPSSNALSVSPRRWLHSTISSRIGIFIVVSSDIRYSGEFAIALSVASDNEVYAIRRG